MEEINNIYTLETLVDYKEHIEQLVKNTSSNELVYNDSAVHASLIMQCILNNSKLINMYCGKFSIFRDNFKNKLDTMFKDPTYDEVRESVAFKEFNPYANSITALKKFFQNGGKMNVIMEEESTPLNNESLWLEIEDFYKNESLKFYQKKDTTDLFHFTVGDDKMYRCENDKELRTALCCFNDTVTSSTLNQCFNIMKSEAESIIF